MNALRRLPAAAAAGVLALSALAPPASAAEPMVEWTRPTLEDNVLEEAGPLTGSITTRSEDNQTIKGVSFELVSDPPVDDQADSCFVEAPDGPEISGEDAVMNFELDVEFPCNGSYELSATVTYDEPLVGAVGATRTTRVTEPDANTIRFSVAIPPARVGGASATFDEATREVRLSWAPNPEPDLLGYFVERNPPGPSGFARINPELLPPDQLSFTDPAIEDEHRYQIVAVRPGPSRQQIQSEPSPPLTAGPERTEPTLPDDIPAPNSRPRAPARSSGDDGARRRAAPAPSRTRTTSNIFQETLPFDPSQTTLPPPTTEPPGDAAVLAEFDDENANDQRATLVPIAGGLALVVGAMHLFLLSKRAGEAEDIPMSPR